MRDDVRSILVINVSRIGDTLLATPALRAIAAKWPVAAIDVLGHPKRVEVLQSLPFLHRVGGISKNTAPLRGRFVGRNHRYDLAFVYGFDASLVRYALRVARHVVGFRQADADLTTRLGSAVELPPFQSDHAVRLALTLPAALGVAPAGLRLSYAVTPEERNWARARLTADMPLRKRPVIGLQVASFPTKAYRDWPIASFGELCQRIREQWPDAHFILFGGEDDVARVSVLKRQLATAATVYAGALSLRQTGAIMERLDLYVGVDTGPTHLMSTFDVPLIGLYHGYSRSELIAPLEHPCLYAVDHPLAGPGCPTEAPMADIGVDRVWAAVQQALSEHPPR